MSTAYILINCDMGKDKSVIEDLKHTDSVKEVRSTFGAYDVIAKVEHKHRDRLRRVITGNVRRIDHIRSAITLMGVDGQNWEKRCTKRMS